MKLKQSLPCLLSLLLVACAEQATRYQLGQDGQSYSRQSAAVAFANAAASRPSQSLDAPLKIISSPMPDYPSSWRAAGVVGTVAVSFQIEKDGKVSSPSIEGSPPPLLAAMVLDSILRWRFEPPIKGGQPTSVRAHQVFTFALQ